MNHGFLFSKSRTKFYYSHIVAIKEMINPNTVKAKKKSGLDEDKEQSDFQTNKGEPIDNNYIIPFVRSLILTEEMNKLTPVRLKLI